MVESLWNHLVFWANDSASLVHREAMRASEAIDVATMKSWVNGSVWTLIVLNCLSLGLYLSALAFPALKQVYIKFHQYRAERAARRLQMKKTTPFNGTVISSDAVSGIATAAAAPGIAMADAPAAEVPAPDVALLNAEAQTLAEVDPTTLSTPSQPSDAAASMSTTEIQEILDIPAPSGVENSMASDQSTLGQEIVEEIALPPIPETEIFQSVETEVETPATPEAVTEVASPISVEPASAEFGSEKTEILEVEPTPEPSLPAAPESAETKTETKKVAIDDPADALASIEASLTEAGVFETNDEPSIFDATALDQVLREEEKQ